MTIESYGQPEAFTVREFCKRYAVGRTKAYELFNSQEVEARKMGTRTLVSRRSAELWFANLPAYQFEVD